MINHVSSLAKKQRVRGLNMPSLVRLMGVVCVIHAGLANARAPTSGERPGPVTSALSSTASTEGGNVPSGQLVRKLYAEYGNHGQPVREQLEEGLFLEREAQKNILQQLPGGFRRYFSERLTELLITERDCAYRTSNYCLMAFDPILAPVEPALANTHFYPLNKASVVLVTFRDKRTLATQSVRYRMVKSPIGWRIDDICYPTGYCLSGILSGRVD